MATGIAGFLAKAYETLQFKANKTAASEHKINALRVVQAELIRRSLSAASPAPSASSARSGRSNQVNAALRHPPKPPSDEHRSEVPAGTVAMRTKLPQTST